MHASVDELGALQLLSVYTMVNIYPLEHLEATSGTSIEDKPYQTALMVRT